MTRRYAKFQHGAGALTRQSMGMIFLDIDEQNETKLKFYSYNLSNALFDDLKKLITTSLQAQQIRYDFLVSIVKVKLGLSHELHHKARPEMLDFPSTPEIRKTVSSKKKGIEVQDIIENKVNGECKKRFNFFPFLRLFNESFDSIPQVRDDSDPVKNHAEQFRQVKQRQSLTCLFVVCACKGPLAKYFDLIYDS